MAEILQGGSPQLNNNSTSYTPTLQIKSDANGGGLVLANTSATTTLDCTSNKLKIAYTHTSNGSSVLTLAPNRLDFNHRIGIESSDAQYQIRSTTYPNAYANVFANADGGNINLSNTAGTCKMTLNMNNSDAVWKREWTSGTSYAREIRITDDSIELTGPLTVNGTLTGSNVQLPGKVRMFVSTNNQIVPQAAPSGRLACCMGTVEIDRNAMVARIRMYLFERTTTSSPEPWGAGVGYIFTPAMILTAAGLNSTYTFDASRLTGGNSVGSGVTGYVIGTVEWNNPLGSSIVNTYTRPDGTQIKGNQRRGAYLLYRSDGNCTVQCVSNADQGAPDAFNYWISVREIFANNGVTIDMVLPITTI